MKKSFTFLFTMLLFAASTLAQVTATANVQATIIAPITIAKTIDMNFGNAFVTAALGTIVLTPANARSATGGVGFLTSQPGVITAASFTVTGYANATYAITLPATATTVVESGGNTMSVDTWTTPSATGLLSGTGSQTFNVGATLHVAGLQAVGVYNQVTPFNVTVNYN